MFIAGDLEVLTSQPGLGVDLLRQLKDVGAVPLGASHITLTSIKLVAIMLEDRGRKDVADQLRSADMQSLLAVNRQRGPFKCCSVHVRAVGLCIYPPYMQFAEQIVIVREVRCLKTLIIPFMLLLLLLLQAGLPPWTSQQRRRRISRQRRRQTAKNQHQMSQTLSNKARTHLLLSGHATARRPPLLRICAVVAASVIMLAAVCPHNASIRKQAPDGDQRARPP